MLFESMIVLLLAAVLAQARSLKRSLAEARRRIEAVERLTGDVLVALRGETKATVPEPPIGDSILPDVPAAVPQADQAPPREIAVPALAVRDALPDREPPPRVAAEPPLCHIAPEAPDPTSPAATAPRPRRDVEFDLGRRWAVLLGGGTLAIGLVLLVRQTLEQELLPPAARLGLAALGSLALVAVAESFRRRGTFAALRPKGKVAAAALPDIPSTLFGAGLAGLFASAYAAHGVYDLVSAPTSFALLGGVALGGLASSLVYGPPLAVLGYVAAQAVPLLVGAAADLTTASYVALTGAAAFGVARLRGWVWLEVLVAGAMTGWVLLLRAGSPREAIGLAAAEAFCVLGAAASRGLSPDGRKGSPDRAGTLTLLALVVTGVALCMPEIVGPGAGPPLPLGSLAGFTIIGLALTASALLQALGAVAPIAAGTAVLALWSGCAVLGSALMLSDVVGGPPPPALDLEGLLAAWALISLAGAAAALIWVRRGSRAGPSGIAGLVSTVAALALGDVVLSRSGAEPVLLPSLAVAQGAVLLLTGRAGGGRHRSHGRRLPIDLAAVAGGLGLGAIALALPLSGTSLTTALGLFVLTAAVLAVLWRAAELLPVLAALGAVSILQGAYHVAATAFDVVPLDGLPEGTRLLPLVAGTLLPGVAIAAALALVSLRLDRDERHRGEAIWRRWLGLPRTRPGAPALGPVVMGASAGGLLLTGSVLILRFLVLGDAYAPGSAPTDFGLAAAYAFAAAATCRRARRVVSSPALALTQHGLVALGAAMLAGALLGNPFTGSPFVGALPLLNLLTLAYLLPALLAGAFALPPDPWSPPWVRPTAAASFLAGTFAWASFSVTQIFQGPVLAWDAVGLDELWAYTPVWLAYAVGMLWLGMRRRERMLRLVAFAAVAGVACKAFLVDLSELSGMPRALSFIALGAVLIGVGMAYQRHMARDPR